MLESTQQGPPAAGAPASTRAGGNQMLHLERNCVLDVVLIQSGIGWNATYLNRFCAAVTWAPKLWGYHCAE